ncbi:MAG: hypothetical protein H0V24_02710 [Chloroflexia bacterium]|nr:hypothetical protein [Chloroflexia bacterium]
MSARRFGELAVFPGITAMVVPPGAFAEPDTRAARAAVTLLARIAVGSCIAASIGRDATFLRATLGLSGANLSLLAARFVVAAGRFATTGAGTVCFAVLAITAALAFEALFFRVAAAVIVAARFLATDLAVLRLAANRAVRVGLVVGHRDEAVAATFIIAQFPALAVDAAWLVGRALLAARTAMVRITLEVLAGWAWLAMVPVLFTPAATIHAAKPGFPAARRVVAALLIKQCAAGRDGFLVSDVGEHGPQETGDQELQRLPPRAGADLRSGEHIEPVIVHCAAPWGLG